MSAAAASSSQPARPSSADIDALEPDVDRLDTGSDGSEAGEEDALARARRLDAEEYAAQHPQDARLFNEKGNAKDVNIADVVLTVAGHELLNLARLRLMHGHRYGLVGKNGIGKSTLLRRIANGQIGGWPAHLKCCLVQQEVESSSATVMESVLASDLERVRLLALEKSLLQSKTPAAEASLNEVYEQLAAIDSDGAEARASEALDELGFTTEMQQQPTNTLSGGWRMRCAIASAMFLSPDVLLLDEPTNHLDVKTVVWLTEYVNSLDITCVIVSHDARFLSDTTTDTIHFHMQSLRYYPTNFDGFLQTRSEQAMNIARQQETLDAKREHIRASIDKVKKQAKKSGHGEMKLGMVASRQKKLGRMGFEKTASGQKFNAQSHGRRIGCENSSSISTEGKRVAMSQIEPPDADFRFSFPEPDMGKIPDGAGLVVMLDVAFGHGLDEAQVERLKAEAREEKNSERVAILGGHVPPVPGPNAASEAFLFANVDFTLRAGQKVGLLGQNGLGKSSLLGLLSGQLPPSRGVVNRHDGVRIGLFEQHLVDALDLTLTPVQHLLLVAPYLKDGGNAEQNARAALGRFGLGSKLALQPIGVLSGGQKARLVFAVITALAPHLIILDEPTNHLDFVTIDALKAAISTFPGAVLLVSHDQSLMEVCGELWIMERAKPPKQPKLNPNQLKAAALKAQKQFEAEARAAFQKARKAVSAAPTLAAAGSASASSSSSAQEEKFVFQSRCALRKLGMTFEEYRESLFASF